MAPMTSAHWLRALSRHCSGLGIVCGGMEPTFRELSHLWLKFTPAPQAHPWRLPAIPPDTHERSITYRAGSTDARSDMGPIPPTLAHSVLRLAAALLGMAIPNARDMQE